jgi:carbonic anhydrase
VCGHTDCGAMKGAMKPHIAESLPHVHEWLSHTTAALARVKARHGEVNTDEHLHEMTEENILLQLKHLETHPSVAQKMAVNELELHGWFYYIGAGKVTCYDPKEGKFVSVKDRYAHLHPDLTKIAS